MKKPVRGNDLPIPLIVGLIIGAVLIGIALLGQERRSLVDVFDEAPTPELPALFANFGDVSQQVVTAWLSDGTSLPAVTPQAVGPRIAVHVDTLHRFGITHVAKGHTQLTTLIEGQAQQTAYLFEGGHFAARDGVGDEAHIARL